SRPPRSRRQRLTVEALEDRAVPTNYPVTDPGDSGAGTLRDAITQSNSAGGTNTIDFEGSNFVGQQATISLLSALPTISTDLTISGTGAANLTVQRDPSAASSFGIFNITTSNTTFDGLTITGGNANSGGGITGSSGNLTVLNCVIKDNTAVKGGGIY